MDKLIVSSIVAVFVSYIGIAIKRIYKVRKNILSSYKDFITMLIDNISYEQTKLADIIERAKAKRCREFKAILNDYLASINENDSYVLKSNYLKKKEKEIIQNCFNAIGRTDSNTQISMLKSQLLIANNMLQCANDDCKYKGELYGKLGILLGIALLILLV